ncbi:Myb-like DNA-binding domain protein (macronuclear) [Tetrahymena thermophila SB210]|uniref:Myb-like DNA-binding domain protein n=1 Tax=Tetrahymena thermophila (strain SB210) TaxID=312017 RepID=Q23AH8_TETTS|nr:Myb-like DNA-binding domain protein [Tetrahymena thermophila SB210]EAR93514.2 Myb-like DNA-binding domain protein [Tetrahymena thermophila SB210]|eukprot:XP_001013759.2 Myb-like DNA-binding domain protein [Tetrahymena thermophila SB210]
MRMIKKEIEKFDILKKSINYSYLIKIIFAQNNLIRKKAINQSINQFNKAKKTKQKEMSELKRHPAEIADGLSMMSPFHKEIKLDSNQVPGGQYFYQINNNPDMLIRQNFISQTPQGYIMNQQQQQQQQQLFQQSQNQQSQTQAHTIGGNPNQFQQQVLPNSFFQNQFQSQQQQQNQQTQQQFQAPSLMNLSFKPISQQQQTQQQQNNIQIQQQNQPSLQQQYSQQSSDSSENIRKSGEKALQYFQTFLQLTQNISDADLNLDFVKDLYTIKMDNLPTSKEMHDSYQKIVSKQGYSKQQKKNWNDQETNLLVWIILKSCVFKRIDFRAISDDVWEDIASMMVGRTSEQCKLKWLSMSKLNLQQQPWSEEEDNILRMIIKEYEQKNKQNKWSEIAVKLNQLSHKNVFRQGKQCRERWNNHLDPAINRGPWNYEEELKMLKLVLEKGKRWSEISKNMKSSRTENAVKNRYNSLIKKEKLSSSSNNLSSMNDLKSNNQDIGEGEKQQILLLIEKLESRIKNGFSLINASSNTLKHNHDQIEEEQDEDTQNQDKQYNEDDEDDDEDDEDHQQSQSMQSQALNSYQIKTEEGNHFNQAQLQQQSLFSNNSKSQNSPESMQQTTVKQKNLPKKNVLQSKQALFQMVESEAKTKSEQTLNQSDVESATKLSSSALSNQNSGGIFKPINQEININGEMNLFGFNIQNNNNNNNNNLKSQINEETISENNSPNMNGKILIQQQQAFPGFMGINSKPGSKRVSLNNPGAIFMEQVKLPSTPLLSGFNHYDLKSQVQQNEVFIKSVTKKNLKKEEFEEEISKSQLVYVDKNTKEIFVINPAFIQHKIQEDFTKNIQLLNSFLQNQESISTPQQHGVNISYAANPNTVQGSAASISMFLNTPPLQAQSVNQLANCSQLGQIVPGEQTPTIFQYYNNLHPTISNSNLGNNSPSVFFMQYSNNNTPNQLGLAQITPQNNMHQQRMINQMPLHQIMHSHNIQNSPNSSEFVKNNNNTNVLQTAAMLNKQLIHQDVQQFSGNTNNLINTNQIQ